MRNRKIFLFLGVIVLLFFLGLAWKTENDSLRMFEKAQQREEAVKFSTEEITAEIETRSEKPFSFMLALDQNREENTAVGSVDVSLLGRQCRADVYQKGEDWYLKQADGSVIKVVKKDDTKISGKVFDEVIEKMKVDEQFCKQTKVERKGKEIRIVFDISVEQAEKLLKDKTKEAFLNEQGKQIAVRQTAERLKAQFGNSISENEIQKIVSEQMKELEGKIENLLNSTKVASIQYSVLIDHGVIVERSLVIKAEKEGIPITIFLNHKSANINLPRSLVLPDFASAKTIQTGNFAEAFFLMLK